MDEVVKRIVQPLLRCDGVAPCSWTAHDRRLSIPSLQTVPIRAVLVLLMLACGAATADAPAGRTVRIGYLAASHAIANDPLAQAFMRGLAELGYVEGRNLQVERRSAEGHIELLPQLAADLVRAKVDVIVAPPTPAALAAVQAGGQVPVVFMLVSDPVGSGLAQSLARPAGMATGLSNQSEDLAGKLLELLKEAVPAARRIAVLTKAGNPVHDSQFIQASAAAARMQVVLQRITAPDYAGFDHALAQLAKLRADGLVVLSDPTFVSRRAQIVASVSAMRLPAIYSFSEFTDAGGLMSYGVNLSEQFKRAAHYVDRIVKGTKPGELPIEQPSSFEFVLNARGAAAIGLPLPRELRLRAARVIE